MTMEIDAINALLKKKIYVTARFLKLNTLLKSGRVYSSDVVNKAISDAAGSTILGKVDDCEQGINLNDVSFTVLKPRISNDTLIGDVFFTDNAKGEYAKRMVAMSYVFPDLYCVNWRIVGDGVVDNSNVDSYRIIYAILNFSCIGGKN